MRRTLAIIVALVGVLSLAAQSTADLDLRGVDPVKSIYQGYRVDINDDGDTTLVILLRDLPVYPPLKFKNKKEKEKYDRLVYNVRRTLPYAKLIAETLIETYEYIETFPSQQQREKHLKQMEKELYEQYKPVLKKFSRNQAKILIKLVQRETNQSSYDIVKAFLGSFRAAFWQGFGRLFGVSLKSNYNPQKNHEDALIERIATQIEQGVL